MMDVVERLVDLLCFSGRQDDELLAEILEEVGVISFYQGSASFGNFRRGRARGNAELADGSSVFAVGYLGHCWRTADGPTLSVGRSVWSRRGFLFYPANKRSFGSRARVTN